MKKKILWIVLILCAVVFLAWWHWDDISASFTADNGKKSDMNDSLAEQQDFSDSFHLWMGMTKEEAEKVIVDEWNGVPGEEYTDINTVTCSYTVEQIGDLEKQEGKIFLEYDAQGLYYIDLFLMDGNQSTVAFLRKVFGDKFVETETTIGEKYMVCTREDGLTVLYDDKNRVIVYDALRDNVWSESRNSEYKININNLTNID